MTTYTLHPGASVIQDGRRIGSLAGVLLDPIDATWRGIVVRRGVLRRRTLVAPRSSIQHASDERVLVGPLFALHAAGESVVAIDGRTAILAADGRRIGRFALLQAGADGQPSAIVVTRGWLGHRLLIPAVSLHAIRPHGLQVDLLSSAFDSLERYRPDLDLTIAARWAIERTARTGRYALAHITVTSHRGTVTLSGNVSTPAHARQLAAAVAAIPGVAGVRNLLVTDDELVTAARQAVRVDARTAALDPDITGRRGAVTLSGHAHGPHVGELATRIIHRLPGVEAVANNLRGPGGLGLHQVHRPGGDLVPNAAETIATCGPSQSRRHG